MAANEFEKNVQRVMDDFKLHPSDEVWQKVEERIRENKRRRRIIFFIVFSFVALTLGGYGIYNYSVNQDTRRVKDVKTEMTARRPDRQAQATSNISHERNDKKQDNKTKNAQKQNQNVKAEGALEKTVNEKFVAQNVRNKRQNVEQSARSFSLKIGEHPLKPNSKIIENRNTTGIALNNGQPVDAGTETQKIAADSINKSVTKNSLPDTAVAKKPDIITYDKKKLTQEQKFKKWKWGFNVSFGVSTITQDPFSFKGTSYVYANTYNAPGTSSGGAGVFYGPSSNQPAFAFKTGVTLKRGISARSSMSAGLSYAYLADKIKIGINPNSSQSSSPSSALQTAYYPAAPRYTYTDHFHFIELPLIYDWRMTKNSNHYFSLSGGVSPSYMLSTNALVYDTAFNGVYYHNKSLFTRMHFNFLTGASYHLASRKNFELATGPQFSFDVSKIIESNVDKRKYFLYIGLDTRIFFEGRKNR